MPVGKMSSRQNSNLSGGSLSVAASSSRSRSKSSTASTASYTDDYMKKHDESISPMLRVSTWCCDGIANQVDSLDILLFNEGEPIDIMLLQATKQPCPSIDGYQYVESIAPEYDESSGVAIYWREKTIIGNTEKIDVEIQGRVIRIFLSWRYMNKDFTIINFHGYEFGKKGSRSKIELMENINTKKGLTKKRKNILGGNFNFIENVKDRATGGEESWNRDKTVRDFFMDIKNYYDINDPFFLENEENYDKNNFKIPFSHEGVARTDRIYLSNDLLQDQFETYTTYIDNPGQNDHCIVTITVNQKTSMEYKENTEEVSDTKTIPMTNEYAFFD